MGREIAYALITPYSLLKSRTGGIIARLLSLSHLNLIGAQMLAPSDEMVDEYNAVLDESTVTDHMKNAFRGYINKNLRPENDLHILNRCMLLLLEGQSAVAVTRSIVGGITKTPQGITIRGTYGDYIEYDDGNVHYFEPAVLIGPDKEITKKHLAVFARYSEQDGGILEQLVEGTPDSQTTLVILKPDNFLKASARTGNIIDIFSRSGLYIVGAKVFSMATEQAEEFYGPLKKIFNEKLKKNVEKRLRQRLANAFDFEISEAEYSNMAESLKAKNAEREFCKIVEYMTGLPCPPAQTSAPAKEGGKCLALLYKGAAAIARIRDRLGATDPSKAKAGTVRSDYGSDLMRNAAHASDSAENATRERKIIGLWENPQTDCKASIERYLEELSE